MRPRRWLLALWSLAALLSAASPPPDSTLLADAVEEQLTFETGSNAYIFVKTPFLLGEEVELDAVDNWPPLLSAPNAIIRSYVQNGQRFFRQLYTVRFARSGVYTLGPFIIRREGRSYHTNPITVIVLNRDERDRPLPLLLSWSQMPQRIYLGQSVLVTAQLNYATSVDAARWSKIPRASGALFDRVSSGSIDVEPVIGGQNSYRIPLARWVLTPTQVGTSTLSAGEVSYLGLERSLPARSIEVAALPPALASSAAIGQFTIWATLEPANILPGTVSTLTIHLEGEGNLYYLRLPAPTSPRLNMVRLKEELDAEPVANGYRGSKVVSYRIGQDDLGSYPIRLDPFRWLDQQGQVQQHDFDPLTLHVSKDFTPLFGNTLLNAQQLHALRIRVIWLRWGWLLLLAPAFLLPPLRWLLRSRGKRTALPIVLGLTGWLVFSAALLVHATRPAHQATVQQAEQHFQQGKYHLALNLYQYMVLDQAQNAGYRINQAIIFYQLGRYLPALTQLYQSQQLLASNTLVEDGLAAVKEQLLLDSVAEPPARPFNLAYLQVSLILLAWLLAGLCGSAPPRGRLIVPSLTLLGGMASVATLLLWPSPRYAITGSKGALLYRVPSALSGTSQQLVQGQRVTLNSYQNDRFLVETANGALGWVEQDRLVLLNEL